MIPFLPPLGDSTFSFITNTANLLPARPGELFSIKAALMYASSSPSCGKRPREIGSKKIGRRFDSRCGFDFGRGEIASSLSILRAICRCRLGWTVLSLALCPPPSPPSVQINRIALLSELTPARFRSIVIMIRSIYLPQLICRNVLAS